MKLWANKKFKKTQEKETHNVSKNTTCQTHTNYAQRKRKITYTLKRDDTVTHEEAHKIRGGVSSICPGGPAPVRWPIKSTPSVSVEGNPSVARACRPPLLSLATRCCPSGSRRRGAADGHAVAVALIPRLGRAGKLQTWNWVTFCGPATQWPGNPATRRPSWPGDPVL